MSRACVQFGLNCASNLTELVDILGNKLICFIAKTKMRRYHSCVHMLNIKLPLAAG